MHVVKPWRQYIVSRYSKTSPNGHNDNLEREIALQTKLHMLNVPLSIRDFTLQFMER